MRRLVWAILAGLCALPFVTPAPLRAEDGAAYPHAATLLFRDEFDSFQMWNGSRGWNVTGGPQWAGRIIQEGTMSFNYEIGWYLNSAWKNATVKPFAPASGMLTIKATPHQQINYFDAFPYTSGMINSFKSFRRKYGYFEIRARVTSGRGFLPAFWLLPADGSHGEIDVMEILGSAPNKLYTTVHSFSTGQLVSKSKATTIPNASSAFHTYGVDWQADFITWYFDGKQVFRAPTPSDLHRPMYMIVNLAVGGTWPGAPPAGKSSALTVDYVRVYNRK